MTSGLVNARFSLPEWQAVKMIFFAPCLERFIACLILTHFHGAMKPMSDCSGQVEI